LRLFGRRWFQIFIAGVALLYLTERTLAATQNPNFIPSVILLGAFLVPVTFTVYLYETLPNWEVPVPAIGLCFLWGGSVGTIAAGTLEYDTLQSLGTLPLFFVALIEEGAKLIVPAIFYLLGRYRSEAAGIILGVASAAGFAALETMGYAFVALLQTRNLAILDEVLIVRGLFSPAGHMAWTGLVAAILWRERLRAGRPAINRRVAGAFLVAVVLHTLWDTFNSLRGATFVAFLSIEFLSLLVAIVSITLLIRHIREARRAGTGSGGRVA
jgi:RsiW-degrading membrane proteinase PrsW (M82 family)